MAIFIAECPAIVIDAGLVHVTHGECEWVWQASTFRRFVERGRCQLDEFDREAVKPIMFHKR